MSYIVYHIISTQIIKEFNTHGGAKRSTTCMNRNARKDENVTVDPYAFMNNEDYRKYVVKRIKVKNLISGAEVEIDSNTPLCCDPSSETYWSM